MDTAPTVTVTDRATAAHQARQHDRVWTVDLRSPLPAVRVTLRDLGIDPATLADRATDANLGTIYEAGDLTFCVIGLPDAYADAATLQLTARCEPCGAWIDDGAAFRGLTGLGEALETLPTTCRRCDTVV